MDPIKRHYPAKLLLFGEHTVLLGSDALAIPFNAYFMKWVARSANHPEWLHGFITYLELNCSRFLNMDQLRRWLESWTIEANIPIGYGLGSSGALCAAIYDVSASNLEKTSIQDLQKIFAVMESHFHGKSSGFDPLVSYFQKPVYKSSGQFRLLDGHQSRTDCKIYLVNSNIPRSGRRTIQKFLELSHSGSREIQHLIQLNNDAIKCYLNPSYGSLLSRVAEISKLQRQIMDYMITENLRFQWDRGIKEGGYYFKVCGAGGGGFYLLFTQKMDLTIDDLMLKPVTFS